MSAGIGGIGIEVEMHEAHQVIPIIERQVLKQGAQVFKEGAARG